MESAVRNLVSLPMSGGHAAKHGRPRSAELEWPPSKSAALSSGWGVDKSFVVIILSHPGGGSSLYPKMGVKGPIALEMILENVRGEQIRPFFI